MTVNYSWLSREALEKVIGTNNLTLEEHPLTIKQLRELQEYDYYSSISCKKIINGKEEFLEIHIWEDEGVTYVTECNIAITDKGETPDTNRANYQEVSEDFKYYIKIFGDAKDSLLSYYIIRTL